MDNNFEIGFLRILVNLKYITSEDAIRLLASFHESDIEQLGDFLLSEGILEQENLLEALSEYYQVPSFDAIGYFFETHLLHMFPKDMLLRNEIIPLQVDENIMIMIAANPNNADLLFEIGENVSYDIRFYVGIARNICDAIKEYYDKADTQDEQDEDIREEHLLMGEFLFIEDEDLIQDEIEDEDNEVVYQVEEDFFE
ncbi:MAG TPA: hypothetical protein VLB80_03945 [Candidatus Babeliales bacterium]|nr:hypothetical protein [Candidatus Babeliales bacterium]